MSVFLLLIFFISLFILSKLYKKGEILHPLFLVSILFLVNTFVGYFKYKNYSRIYLLDISDSDVIIYLIIILLSYLFSLLGWILGVKIKIVKRKKKRRYSNRGLLFLASFFFLIFVVSHHSLVNLAGGYMSFYSHSHMSALGSQLEGTPVIYMFGMSLGVLSILLSVLAITNNSQGKVNKRILRFAIFLSIIYLIPQLLSGDRGEMLKISLIWMSVYIIFMGWKPPKKILIISGVFVGVLFLGAGAWRENLTLNSEISVFDIDKTISAAFGTDVNYKGDIFYLSTLLIKTSRENTTIGYGIGYYNYFIHLTVPKAIVPFKDDLYLYDARKELINKTGYNIGATFDGISDSFVEFNFFSPLVWFMYFFFLARVYKRMYYLNKDIWLAIIYIMSFISVIWMFSHGTIVAIGNLIFTLFILRMVLIFRQKKRKHI